jgi:hypothetical protein
MVPQEEPLPAGFLGLMGQLCDRSGVHPYPEVGHARAVTHAVLLTDRFTESR